MRPSFSVSHYETFVSCTIGYLIFDREGFPRPGHFGSDLKQEVIPRVALLLPTLSQLVPITTRIPTRLVLFVTVPLVHTPEGGGWRVRDEGEV